MKILKNEYKNRTLSEYELSYFLRTLRSDGLEIQSVHKKWENLIQFTKEFLIILLKKYKTVTKEMINVYKKSLRIANIDSSSRIILCGEDFGIGSKYPNENTGGLLDYIEGINEFVSISVSFDFSWNSAQENSKESDETLFILPPTIDIKLADIIKEKDKEILKKLLIEISKCKYKKTNYLSHLCTGNSTYSFLRNHIKKPVTWNKLLKFDEKLFNEYLRLYKYDKDSVFVEENSSILTTTENISTKEFENEPRVILNKLRKVLEK